MRRVDWPTVYTLDSPAEMGRRKLLSKLLRDAVRRSLDRPASEGVEAVAINYETLLSFPADALGEKPSPARNERVFEFGAEAVRNTFDVHPLFERIIDKRLGRCARQLFERHPGENADARGRALGVMRRCTLDKVFRHTPCSIVIPVDNSGSSKSFEPTLVL